MLSAKSLIQASEVGAKIDTHRRCAPAQIHLKIHVAPDNPFRAELVNYWNSSAKSFHQRIVPTAVNTWEFSDCILVPPHMLIVTSDGELINESIRKRQIASSDNYFAHLFNDKLSDIKKIEYIDSGDSVFVGSGSQHLNYFHWLIESIPRFHWEFILQKNIKIIMPKKINNFHRETIDIFQKSKNSVAYISKPTKFSKIIYLEHLAKTNMRVYPYVAEYFRNHKNPISNSSNRILVSRNDAKTRRIIGEELLFSKLSPIGFEIIQPGKSTVSQQMQMFGGAECVVGAHGAGLANLVFCQPGTKVFELIPNSFKEGITCYAALCEILDLDYHMVVLPSENREAGASADIRIDLNDSIHYVLSLIYSSLSK